MTSLQKFLFNRDVAAAFAMSPSGLYERQRALVRVGLLPQASSRGPKGGGAMATPDTVAMVLLSVLVTDSLSEVDERIATWASLRALNRDDRTGSFKVGTCHLTKQKTLHKAISRIIANSVHDGTGNLEVSVHRGRMSASIVDVSGQSMSASFGHGETRHGVQLSASFSISDIATLGAFLDGDGS